MKKFTTGLVLIFWMLFTILLAVSLVGMVVLIREDHNIDTFRGKDGEAVWFRLGKKLVKSLVDG